MGQPKQGGISCGVRVLEAVLVSFVLWACNGVLAVDEFKYAACQEGARQCSGDLPQLCTMGQWQNEAACNGQRCSNGECVPACNDGDRRCSGQLPQTCTVGEWQDASGGPCVDTTCVAGECTGDCAPGDKRCQGLTPQTCGELGEWAKAGEPCDVGSGFYCSGGDCVQNCTPGDLQCSGNVPQVCDAIGRWQNHGPVCDPCVGCDPTTAACKTTSPVVCGVEEYCGNGTCSCRKPVFFGELFFPVGRAPVSMAVVDLNGDSQLALPKDVQRHPIRSTIEHVDLLVVRRGEKVTVDVPLHLTGDAAPGGQVNVELTTLSVETEATSIPESIEHSIEGIEVGAQLHAGQITLPSGTTLVTDAETIVAVVSDATRSADGAEGAAEDEAATEG